MRILVDQGVPHHRNRGNNALLEVAMRRLAKFWPRASFEVISIAPHLCKTYLPGTIPVSPDGLFPYENQLGPLDRVLPNSMWRLLFELREVLSDKTGWFATPQRMRQMVGSFFSSTRHEVTQETSTFNTRDKVSEASYLRMRDFDLFVAAGGGFMCDFLKQFVLQVLDRLEAAVTHGVPVVMVGQGIGPIDDPELRDRAAQILPFVDYIMIREEAVARPLLDSFNVPRSKVMMTGDDAIELAYQLRSDQIGNGIGLGWRVANYTQLNASHLQAVRSVVLRAARRYSAKLVSVPIDWNERDKDYIEEIMHGHPHCESSWRKFNSSTHAIKQIRQCRLMISSAFHPCVFALSQGIPVIALAGSAAYQDKLSGLSTEFGNRGCQVVHLNDPNVEKRLEEAIHFAWDAAEKLRPQLLHQAERQIQLGHAAYQKIYSLVETSSRSKAHLDGAPIQSRLLQRRQQAQ